MSTSPSSDRLADALAEARATDAVAVLVGSFGAIGDGVQRLHEMYARLEEARAGAKTAAIIEVGRLLDQVETLTTGKMTKRLVEADAVISPVGRKCWLGDIHRAARQAFNCALEDFAADDAPIQKADAARQVLSASLQALQVLGRPLEPAEKPRKARTASRRFIQEDYEDREVRCAIVLMALNDDAAAGELLESRAYHPALDRDGRISCVVDALRSDDRLLRDQAVQLAVSILGQDAADYRIELSRTTPLAPVVVASGTLGDRARAAARGAA